MARFPGATLRLAAGTTLAGLLLVQAPVIASLPGVTPPDPAEHPAVPQLTERGRFSFAPAAKHSDTGIRFANGITFDTRQGEPLLPAALRMDSVTEGTERVSVIVQVTGPVKDGWVQAIEAAGGAVEFFIPNYASVKPCCREHTGSTILRRKTSEVPSTFLCFPGCSNYFETITRESAE